MTIRLCVFDLGGTIVDKFSLSPFYSLKRAFKNEGILVPNALIFKDMGKHKKDHIKEILDDKYIGRCWMNKYGSYPKENDVNDVFTNSVIFRIMKELIKSLSSLKLNLRFIHFNKIIS